MRIVIEVSQVSGISVRTEPPSPDPAQVLEVLNRVVEATRLELAVRTAAQRITGGLVLPAAAGDAHRQ